MPKTWYDRHAASKIEDSDQRELYRRLLADKKPYFMRYIYPSLMRQYNTYVKNTDKNALREFQMTVDELKSIPVNDRTDRMNEFLHYYSIKMPVGDNDCVMNRICRRFEIEFDGYIGKHIDMPDFDYTIMKSGAEYTKTQYTAISKLHTNYNKRLRSFAMFASYERIDDCEAFRVMMDLRDEFMQECVKVCPNQETLCDIVLDITYKRGGTKKFAWEICGEQIIKNLLGKNNSIIRFTTKDSSGDIVFCGERFSVNYILIGDAI